MRVSKEGFLHVCRPGIVVLILSSRRILSFSVILTLFSDVLTWDCCCRRCCFSRRPGFTRIVMATVSRCTLEDSASFRRCSNLVNHTRDFPRYPVKIRNTHYRNVLPFRAMMNRNCPYSCFQRSPVWSLCTAPRSCIGRACFSPFTSAASEEFSTLEIALANILRDVLVLLDVADVHQCSKVDFPYPLFLCVPSLWPPFTSGINIAWGERSFIHTSRFPEAYVSERQITRVFWTIRNSRFPKLADQNHIRSSYFFLPKFTLESISYSPDFEGLLEEICLVDTLCRETRQHVLAFTFKGN